MSTPEAPTFGPCADWISGADVAAVCTALDSSGDPTVYDDVAHEACEILWAASGRQYSGVCGPVTVRPCVKDCGCWGFGWGGLYDFSWNTGGWWIAGCGSWRWWSGSRRWWRPSWRDWAAEAKPKGLASA